MKVMAVVKVVTHRWLTEVNQLVVMVDTVLKVHFNRWSLYLNTTG